MFTVLAAIELGRRVYQTSLELNKLTCLTPDLIYDHYRTELTNLEQEHFYALFLNSHRELIKKHLLFIGTNNISLTHPRDIFREAILCNASYLICLHNHPSSNKPIPSLADIEFTKKVNKLGDLHSIPLLDHIIIGNTDYYSFYEEKM